MNTQSPPIESLTKTDLQVLLKEHQETIHALQHQLGKCKKIFNNSLDGIYQTAPDGSAINANAALVKMLGYSSKEELLAIDVKNNLYVNYENRQDVINHFSKAKKMWHQLYKKDGSTIWVENHGEVIKNKDGEVLYYEGIIRDVTKIKRANDIQKALLNISHYGYEQENLKGYTQFIIHELGKLVDVSNSYIAYYNKNKQTISIPFISGEEAEEEFSIDKTITGYLIRNKQPLLLRAAEFEKLEEAGEIELVGVASKIWLGVPLVIDGEVIGAIVLQSYDDENAFQQNDIDLLELVSSHISIAIQRKRKSFELRKFSLAVEQSASTIVITDINGNIEYVNEKFTETTGYTKEEAIGINPRILNSGNQDKNYYTGLWKTISSGHEWVGEFQNKSKTGRLYWERAVITPIKSTSGIITNYLAIKEDITLKKEQEEELAMSKEVLRKVLDNIPIRVFWKDKESRFLGCNKSYLKGMGLENEEDVIGKTDHDVHSEKDADRFRIDELEIMQSAKPKLRYIETITKLNKKQRILTSKVPFFNNNGNVIGVLGASEDITERIEQEEELAMSKEVLRKVLDNIPIRVFWKDKESKFLGCNKAFYEGISLTSDKEVIGKTDYDWNAKEVADKTRNDELEIQQTGIPKLRLIEKFIDNGKEVIFSSNKMPFIDQNNNIIGTIGTSVDITERLKSTEKLKIATEKAISANLSKSIFLSNMSHEIRTPMNAILGYSQLLQDDSNLTKVQFENLKTINRSGEHLLALINDILDMSKIEAGRITLKETDFNFKVLLKEVEGLFKFKAAKKRIELNTTILNKIPEIIFADESKIRQVIINLIGNALKFTSKGFVHITVESLNDNYITVSVKDSGVGIIKEEQESVFKPFEQAQQGERISGGTGLGLAISKKFSHLMEGDITVKSEYGEGSEFIFKFKYKESEQTEIIEELEELKVISLTPEMKGLKLAIVDDRFENRDILYQKLNPLGFDIKEAENGLEAVELYKEWKPDIILLDVVMPVLNGIEATRQILKLRGDHNVKIFIVSASALESEQQEVMEIGATVFIKKPVKFVNLLDEMVHKAGVEFVYETHNKIEVLDGSVSEITKTIKEKFINAALEGDFLLLEELHIDLEKSTNKSFKYLDDCIKEMEFEELINWLKS